MGRGATATCPGGAAASRRRRRCPPPGYTEPSACGTDRSSAPFDPRSIAVGLRGRSAAEELEQIAAADDQRLAPLLLRALEGAVLDLDGDRPVVAGVGEGAEEGAPADVAQAGDLRR